MHFCGMLLCQVSFSCDLMGSFLLFTMNLLINLINLEILKVQLVYDHADIACLLGANTIKYTTPLPCIGLSESDLKYRVALNLVKKKIINIWKTY